MLRKLALLTVAMVLVSAPAFARTSAKHHHARTSLKHRHPRGRHAAHRTHRHVSLLGLSLSGRTIAASTYAAGAATSKPGVSEVPVSLSGPTFYAAPSGAATFARSSSSAPMSLATALARAPQGSVIHLQPGTYPQVDDYSKRSNWVTISGLGDATAPTIAGAHLYGAQYLRFVDVKFSSLVYISSSPWVHLAQPAENIQLLDSEVDCGSTATSPNTIGIWVRGGSQNVTVSGDYVHNCVVGFASMAQDPVSTNVTITHSTFENFPGDAMDLGGLSGVTIDHDVIRNIADPAGSYHDDGIQFFGNVAHVQITNNVLANSRDQLIFIQDAVRSWTTGSAVNSDILVARNLIYGAGGFAVQDQGAQDVRFIGNTMWSNHYGSLLVRRSGYTGLLPSEVIVGNIIQGLGFSQATAAYEDYNLITSVPATYVAGSHDVRNAEPGFISPGQGNFQLAAGSPARSSASPAAAQAFTRGVAALSTDMFGLSDSPWGSLGAFQPSDPDLAYGAPLYGPSPLL